MGAPRFFPLTVPNDAPVIPPAVVQAMVAASTPVSLAGAVGLGYEIVLDPGAAFTADLEASVNGIDNWTIIAALATGQGAIDDRYQYARINVIVAGDLGATTSVLIGGKDR